MTREAFPMWQEALGILEELRLPAATARDRPRAA
jgi:hypothetical protein